MQLVPALLVFASLLFLQNLSILRYKAPFCQADLDSYLLLILKRVDLKGPDALDS